jgi:uncharacterized membrane protein YdfJ with MMPL/SSD domain
MAGQQKIFCSFGSVQMIGISLLRVYGEVVTAVMPKVMPVLLAAVAEAIICTSMTSPAE